MSRRIAEPSSWRPPPRCVHGALPQLRAVPSAAEGQTLRSDDLEVIRDVRTHRAPNVSQENQRHTASFRRHDKANKRNCARHCGASTYKTCNCLVHSNKHGRKYAHKRTRNKIHHCKGRVHSTTLEGPTPVNRGAFTARQATKRRLSGFIFKAIKR